MSKTLNALLQPIHVTSAKNGTAVFDRWYTYNNRGLVSAITDSTNTTYNQSFSYDGLGQLTTASGKWGSGSFKYDTLGNIRQKKLGARTVNMSYDSKMRMTSYTDTAGPNKSLSYDNRGNVTALGALNMGYDYSDQPTSVSGSASGIYKYDGNMKRVKSVVGGKTTYSVYDASGTLVHIDNTTTNKKTDYVAGGGMSLARITNNVVTYLHNDHLGSLGVGTNASGTSLWAERYTPFGETLINNTANDDLGGYTGHIKDSATGLNYMQARYMDPITGRFLSTDPVGFSVGRTGMFNRYSYVLNNPMNAIDPTGEILQYVLKNGATPGDAVASVLYLSNSPTALSNLTSLGRSRYIYTVVIDPTSKGSSYKPEERTIYYNPRFGQTLDDGSTNSPASSFGHELSHAVKHNNGELPLGEDKTFEEVMTEEYRATDEQNKINRELNTSTDSNENQRDGYFDGTQSEAKEATGSKRYNNYATRINRTRKEE